MTYLAEKYGKIDSLYPKDPAKRAVVNQLMYFDMGTLYQRFADYYYPQIFGSGSADDEKSKKMQEAVEFFNKFLEGRTYAAGNNLTLADLTLLATISTYEVAGFALKKYPNVKKWYDKVRKEAPGADINQKGADEFKQFFN
uniref:GST C-terminal domain-containing protein n=1 Tax=Megaselia scalaris TaxID=36166 RepID=T1GYQ6_MEGSC